MKGVFFCCAVQQLLLRFTLSLSADVCLRQVAKFFGWRAAVYSVEKMRSVQERITIRKW